MTNPVAVEYFGLTTNSFEEHEDLIEEIRGLIAASPLAGSVTLEVGEPEDRDLPEAERGDSWWVAGTNGERLAVFYDDEELLEYEAGSDWADLSELILDAMDRVAIAEDPDSRIRLADYPE